MVPEGWKKTTLGRLAEITSGGTPSRSRPEYWGGDIPWVTTAEIRNGTITGTKERITQSGLENSSAKVFPEGAILLAMYGQGKTRGQVARLGIAASTNQACAAILPKETVCGQYIFQNLLARYDEIRNLSNDGSQKNLSGTLVKSIPILQPPPREQRAIAQVLSTWDRAIEMVDKIVANSETQKRALMQRLLFSHKSIQWTSYAIGDLGTTYGGLSGKSKGDFGHGVPYIPYLNIFSNARLDTSYLDHVWLGPGERQSSARYGDIFFTTSSETPDEVGMSSVLLDNVDGLYLNSFCFGFRLNDFKTLRPEFACFLFRAPLVRRAISKLAQGATRYNLPKGEFLKLELLLPPVEDQLRITECLSNADAAICIPKKNLINLKTQKRALMQQLLSGKLRVSTAQDAERLPAMGLTR